MEKTGVLLGTASLRLGAGDEGSRPEKSCQSEPTATRLPRQDRLTFWRDGGRTVWPECIRSGRRGLGHPLQSRTAAGLRSSWSPWMFRNCLCSASQPGVWGLPQQTFLASPSALSVDPAPGQPGLPEYLLSLSFPHSFPTFKFLSRSGCNDFSLF